MYTRIQGTIDATRTDCFKLKLSKYRHTLMYTDMGWCFTIFVLLVIPNLTTGGQHNADNNEQTPAFTPDQTYMDIFTLTKDNFTQEVLKSPDPWVILFHQGILERVWKDLAVGLRGVVWVGMVDTEAEGDLLQQIVSSTFIAEKL